MLRSILSQVGLTPKELLYVGFRCAQPNLRPDGVTFSICVAFYNFIRPHETLSRADDRRFLPKTPAMAAGITDHQWTTQELLAFKT